MRYSGGVSTISTEVRAPVAGIPEGASARIVAISFGRFKVRMRDGRLAASVGEASLRVENGVIRLSARRPPRWSAVAGPLVPLGFAAAAALFVLGPSPLPALSVAIGTAAAMAAVAILQGSLATREETTVSAADTFVVAVKRPLRLSRFEKLRTRWKDQHPGFPLHLYLSVTTGKQGAQVIRINLVVFGEDHFSGDEVLTHGPHMLPGMSSLSDLNGVRVEDMDILDHHHRIHSRGHRISRVNEHRLASDLQGFWSFLTGSIRRLRLDRDAIHGGAVKGRGGDFREQRLCRHPTLGVDDRDRLCLEMDHPGNLSRNGLGFLQCFLLEIDVTFHLCSQQDDV